MRQQPVVNNSLENFGCRDSIEMGQYFETSFGSPPLGTGVLLAMPEMHLFVIHC